jgi:DNA gyrase inhibitor GyrI
VQFEMEVLAPCKLAYIRQVGPYGAENARTMESLKNWADAHRLLKDDAVILGIAWDDPQITEPESCRYDACLIVPENFSAEGKGVRLGELAGGPCAVFKVEHTGEAVRRAWSEIFPELEKRKLRPDSARPILERYAAHTVREHFCEICIPVL